MGTESAPFLAVMTRVYRPRPTETGVEDGVDYDAEVVVTDEAGITTRWQGELTYAPAQYDGRLVPYGPTVDLWMSGSLIMAIDSDRSGKGVLAKAITESLGSGEGIEYFDVAI